MKLNLFKRNVKPQNTKESAVGKLSVQFVLGRAISSKRNYEKISQEVYAKNVIAYQCIKKIATAAASVNLKLFRGGDKNRAQIDNHPLIDLIYRPNIMQSDDEFFRALYSTFLIGGEVFLERIIVGGQIKEIWLHSPRYMHVVPGITGVPAAYKYKTGAGEKDFPMDPITGYCDILHIKEFNPDNSIRGQSIADPAAFSIDQHNEASAWNYALLANGCRPSGALSVNVTESNPSGSLTDEQFDRLKGYINDSMSGGSNAGKPIILEGGMEWKEFSLSPRDMDFVETVNTAARNISLAYGVPPILLGIPGDSTYNNLKEAKVAFYEDTVLPLIKYTLSSFNNWIEQIPSNKQFYFEEDRNSIEALFTRTQELRESLKNTTWLTDNEKRAMEGLEPLAGGDELQSNQQIPMPNIPPVNGSKDDYILYLVKEGYTKEQAKEIASLVYA